MNAYERYPWAEWTDGHEHAYIPPYVSVQTFRTYLYARAKRVGMTVNAIVDGDTIRFRFFRDRSEYVANKLKRTSQARNRSSTGQFYTEVDTTEMPHCRICAAPLAPVALDMGECGRWSDGGTDGSFLPKHHDQSHLN